MVCFPPDAKQPVAVSMLEGSTPKAVCSPLVSPADGVPLFGGLLDNNAVPFDSLDCTFQNAGLIGSKKTYKRNCRKRQKLKEQMLLQA
eukprot:1801161-Prorocentrum_lima.AAC.1